MRNFSFCELVRYQGQTDCDSCECLGEPSSIRYNLLKNLNRFEKYRWSHFGLSYGFVSYTVAPSFKRFKYYSATSTVNLLQDRADSSSYYPNEAAHANFSTNL